MLPALSGGFEDCIVPVLLMFGVQLTSRSDVSLRKLLRGALAGFVATAPMSLSMLIGWWLLPKHEKYHLPPRLITEQITERAGIEHHLGENELIGLTGFSHFGYGAVTGALYVLVEQWLPLPSSLKGAFAGLAVWVGSYLGWLPAMGVLTPATRHPWRRNLLMIVAHVVWGVSLGKAVRKLNANE